MTHQFDVTVLRKVLPIAAIAAAVIYGVHGTILEPDAEKLAQVRADLHSARERQAEILGLQSSGGNLRDHVNDLRLQLANVRSRSAVATDQRELFERISLIAHNSGIELEQVRSLDWKAKADSTGESNGQAAGSACTLTLSGSYASICEFVGKVEKSLGFATVTRLRMHPNHEGAGVLADLDLACFAPPLNATKNAAASGGNP